MKPRVVIAGLGDTGVLVGIHLARHADVVGISSKPALVSGQELGLRLARPDSWARHYRVGFDRFRRLRGARFVHASLLGLDVGGRTVRVRLADGSERDEPYDVLVISTGVSNGFWRTPTLQSQADVDADIDAAHAQIADADSVMVIGGGAAAISSAWNIAARWPDKRVDLYFPGEAALPQHHPKVWGTLRRRFEAQGIGVHPGHRAVLPQGFDGERITSEPVAWSTGQADAQADVVLWAVGRVRPNSRWIPDDLLDADGFVRVDEFFRVPGAPGVYAIGDIAASDPLRTSARARADHLVAHNIRTDLGHGRPKPFKPARRRWGSVLGAQDDRLEVFTPGGQSFGIRWWDALQPWFVNRAIYKGIRRER